MDMYEITLNVMYTAAVLVLAFTGAMWLPDKKTSSTYYSAVVVFGWYASAAVWAVSIITLIWVK